MDSGELQDYLSSSGIVKFQISHASINMLVQRQVMAIWNWSSGELCGPWDSCFAFLRLSSSHFSKYLANHLCLTNYSLTCNQVHPAS